jgi:hypothetical protein
VKAACGRDPRFLHLPPLVKSPVAAVLCALPCNQAAIELSPSLRVTNVSKLFDAEPPPRGVTGRPYDVSPLDGRFIVTRPVAQVGGETVQISVVLNWFEELGELVPVR